MIPEPSPQVHLEKDDTYLLEVWVRSLTEREGLLLTFQFHLDMVRDRRDSYPPQVRRPDSDRRIQGVPGG